jgi:hypothetical protein
MSNPRTSEGRGVTHRSVCTAALLAAPVLLLLTGCTDWAYRQIQLGQSAEEYERVLPAETSRRTAVGLCHLSSDRFGRTDAFVVLLTGDRRVAGKLRARHYERDWGLKVDRGFWLEGELDPELYGVQSAGPLDTLRAIAGDLTDYRGEKLALDAHAWVAAGLVRLMQRWPGVEDVGVSSQRLSELFELVPGGGAARLEVNERGIYRLEYKQGTTR